jgi:hypothetical protein
MTACPQCVRQEGEPNALQRYAFFCHRASFFHPSSRSAKPSQRDGASAAFRGALLRDDSSENKYLETMRAIPGVHGVLFTVPRKSAKKEENGKFP